MAETDGRGRKSVNMLRPRAVWIEADGPLPRELPLLPSIVVETSPGKYHYIYVCRDLDWPLWHGVQQVLISEYGSDPRAGLKTQVLRLAGTLHQKNPAKPHLVRIVEEQPSDQVYTSAEIAVAFPPKSTPPPLRVRQRNGSAAPGADWDPETILSAFIAIDAQLKESGPFTAQRDGRPIQVDWSCRNWWFRAVSAIHHASGGSEAGFELSCQVSAGDSSIGLIGCPSKFDKADQRRVWDSLSNEVRGCVTIRTIYWIAHDFAGWSTGRRGRPLGQPREIKISERAQAVADAGMRTVLAGLDPVRERHTEIFARCVKGDALKGRILAEIRALLNPSKGVAAIDSLTKMANRLGCSQETLRRYLRELAQKGTIIKNDGNAASMFSTSGGITIALSLPEWAWPALNHQQSTAAPHPPISDTTGTATPHFQAQAGWNVSRSPSSHEVGQTHAPPGHEHVGASCHLSTEFAVLWSKPNLTFEEWTEARVIHAEFGHHMEDLANRWSKAAVSRVLVCLEDLRTLRKSFEEIRHDAERAADLAARSLARKEGKAAGLTEADIAHMIEVATPARVDREHSANFVREMARHLKAIVRLAQGHPDPWGNKRWRERQQQSAETQPKGNAYAEARFKRDPPAS